ncbi:MULTISPECIES: class I SAM-dependent methyltransferase [Mameliella]|uniref:class I SAM-dependent methyltransferase n=1 Tax=Mameliella TaxID=1434019 RepID=UPI000B53045D|nr:MULTISPECIES: class I SAM-dependent methyltransferase [Mameliella]MCR9275278.1 class I SAM-dependent methyltransferase [Paracoccaceae bacterium]OWV59150.1 hypothetical protein CDZ98_12640 [Mameliella alba]
MRSGPEMKLFGAKQKTKVKIEPIGAVTPLGHRATGLGDRLPAEARARVEPGFPLVDGPHYHDVLAALHEVLTPDWYLEIGTFRGASLSLCPGKFVAIDPQFLLTHFNWAGAPRGHFFQQTSDDFFAGDFLHRNGIQPQLGFLDGMHLFEYLLRDFINFERVVAPGGAVVLHDCLPGNSQMEARDRNVAGAGEPWTGDVWKVLQILLDHRLDLTIDVVDAFPTGLVIVRGLDPDNDTLAQIYNDTVARLKDVPLAEFGPNNYFDRFTIQSSHSFLKALTAQTSEKGT